MKKNLIVLALTLLTVLFVMVIKFSNSEVVPETFDVTSEVAVDTSGIASETFSENINIPNYTYKQEDEILNKISNVTSKKVELKLTYPRVAIKSDKKLENKINTSIKKEAKNLPIERYHREDIYGKIDCEVNKNKRVLSVKYFGDCYIDTKDLVNGLEKTYVELLCATAYDMATGKKLYIFEIYNITENLKELCLKYGSDQVPDVHGAPFSASWASGIDDGEKTLKSKSERFYVQFYFTKTHLVLLYFMRDNRYYPFQIPLQEIAQDLKEEYKPYLSGK